MAKKSEANVKAVMETTADGQQTSAESHGPAALPGLAAARPQPNAAAADGRNVMLELPLIRTAGYVARTIDLTLSGAQAQALRDLADGLIASGARLANRALVCDASAALRWLLERIAMGDQ